MNFLKRDLRHRIRAKIAEQNSSAVSGAHIQSLERQLESLLHGETGHWGAFAALPDEPRIQFHKLKTSVSWVYPRIEGDHIQFYDAAVESLSANKWGIREPDPKHHKPVAIENLNGVCVPGLAFDNEGYRLGRGKGYYDRALHNFKGKTVGIAYSWQIVEGVPRESFDVRMDTVVTENSIIRVSERSHGGRK